MKKKTALDRRTFVTQSAALAGGLLLAPELMRAKGFNSVDDTIKIGLIGCGGRGTGAALQALSSGQNVQLTALADVFRDRLESSLAQLSKEWAAAGGDPTRIKAPQEHQFVGFDAFEKVLPLCDVVLIATPPGFRPAHFAAAVAAGKHVFMEKPLAVDAPGVRQVLAAAEVAKQKKLNVVVGLQRHYEAKYRTWIQRLQDGAIGEIHTAHVYWNSEGVWVNPRQKKQTEMEYQLRNWYYFNWLCGDHIVEQHIHNLDVANWAKQAYPIKASGMGGRQVRTGKDYGEIFDHHFVEYEYADGSRMYSQCRHIPGCIQAVTESFQGSRGRAPEPGLIKDEQGKTLFRHNDKQDPNPYQVEHDELFAAIASGSYRFADAEAGAKSTLTAIMGRMATYSGQLIEWEQALQSTISLQPERLAWDALPKVLPDKNGFYPIAIPGKTVVG